MAQTVVQISGHIIDSLILPKVLDLIISLRAEFEILDIQIGHRFELQRLLFHLLGQRAMLSDFRKDIVQQIRT
ncbi:MAG: hypothetical protein GEU77_03935 [Deltaproteobacteria bacterium]|nr:hypothetical protein [Deltaproteobacteria bacterium]